MSTEYAVRTPCVRRARVELGTVLAGIMLVLAGCANGPNIPDEPDEPVGLAPDESVEIVVIDVQRTLSGDAPSDFQGGFVGELGANLNEIGVEMEDVSTIVIAVVRDGPDAFIASGNLDFEQVRRGLHNVGMSEEQYHGFELWEGGQLEWARSVAVLEDAGHIVVGKQAGGSPPRILRGLDEEERLIAYSQDSPVHALIERAGDAWYVGISIEESCGRIDVRECEAVAWANDSDGDNMTSRWIYHFADERAAGAAVEHLEDLFGRTGRLAVEDISEDGRHVTVTTTLAKSDWTVQSFWWPANPSAAAPVPQPAQPAARAASQPPAAAATPRPAPPAPAPAPIPAAAPPVSAPAPTAAPYVPPPEFTAPSPDRDALIALYEATGGADWARNINWLSELHVSHWQGVKVNADGRVITLELHQNGMTGELPPELGSLRELTGLYLHGNQLEGAIPPELGSLRGLQELTLFHNDLSGKIPAELADLAALRTLNLGGNQLSGEIPAELASLTDLRTLYLGGNQLSGEVPAGLGDLNGLENLNLSRNMFTGEIPPELGNLSGLRWLALSGNMLVGCIPSGFQQLQLVYTDLYEMGLPPC